MKKVVFALFISIFLNACMSDAPNPDRFKEGLFEIPEGKGYKKTSILRKDSLQIETYGTKVDTLVIKWKDQFNYTLKILYPKSAIDYEPISVKITDISRGSYEFEATVGNSNYVQKGKVVIKED